MQNQFDSPEKYLEQLPPERQIAMGKLRSVILKSLPEGFVEAMSYGMIGYVIPHSLYPRGYHVNPLLPLPFIHIASQKNFIALYHYGIYSDPLLLNWFLNEFTLLYKSKPDMGKSCIRFKKTELIPYQLIGELCSKVTVQEWIDLYERATHKIS